MTTLRSPYPYFGGKSRIAAEIWKRFGNTPNYVEPFFGSGAVLLARPHKPGLELVNDMDGMIVNFWRAVQADAEAVAGYADCPAFENDLHARHAWLVQRKDSLRERLEGDPDFYDAKVAGWWVWGMSLWIGSGFCSGRGSWTVQDGLLVKAGEGAAVARKLPVLTVQQGIKRNRIELAASPKGVQRKLPVSDAFRGVSTKHGNGLYAYFADLQARFRRVRVTCGDWTRVVTPAVLTAKTPCAVFLDPPYTSDGREGDLYNEDDGSLHVAVRDWAIANGDNPQLRIAYCGYDDGFDFPTGWEKLTWKANGGYSNQGEDRRGNATRETVWFSPHCLKPEQQLSLFTEGVPT